MTESTMRDRKKALFIAVAERLQPLWPGPVRTRRNADGAFWFVTLPGGVEAQVHLATLKDGLPVGEFAVQPTMLVRGGPLAERLAAVAEPPGHVGRIGAVLMSMVRVDRGIAGSAAGIDWLVDWIVKQVTGQFMPDMLAFSGRGANGGWTAALCIAATYPNEVDRPEHTAAILRELAATDSAGRGVG